MYVFRMREYKSEFKLDGNNHKHKIEAVSENRAQRVAEYEGEWIYFFVDLIEPEDL